MMGNAQAARTTQDPTLVYLAGYNYSGTTLLALLLAAHPMIGTTGEITGPPHFEKGRPFTCSCGVAIQECSFYSELQRKVDRPDLDLQRRRWRTRVLPQEAGIRDRLFYGTLRSTVAEWMRDLARRMPTPAARTFDARVDLNARFIRAAMEMMSCSVLVDSSKAPTQIPALAVIPQITLKVIHLVRHPCGCAVSAAKHNGLSYRVAATIWKRNFRACRRQINRFVKDTNICVRYEDLCVNPSSALCRIADFLRVPFSERMLDVSPVGYHIVGNDMRLRADTEIKLDEKWRMVLSKKEIAEVARITHREAEACGYSYD